MRKLSSKAWLVNMVNRHVYFFFGVVNKSAESLEIMSLNGGLVGVGLVELLVEIVELLIENSQKKE
jgi:hypothetical protein